MDIEKLADKARKEISRFCAEECRAYCCRKGYLIMSGKELKAVVNNMKDDLITKNLLKKIEDNRYSLFMGKTESPCPSLKEWLCTIHKKRLRPSTCKDYPIFIRDNQIHMSHRCLAV